MNLKNYDIHKVMF